MGFIRQQYADLTPDNSPLLAVLVDKAIAYYQDFVKPHKAYRAPNAKEREALTDICAQPW